MEKLSRRDFLLAAMAGAVTCSVVAFPKPAFADPTSAEVQAQADEVAAQLAEWQEQLDICSDNYYRALEEHDAAVAAMNEAQARMDAAQARIEQLQEHLSNRAVEMYKNGSVQYVDVLLGATSFNDFTSTWDFLEELNEEDAAAVEEMKAQRAEAEAARDEYARQAEIAQQKLDEAEAAKEEAEAIVAQYEAELASLEAQVAELAEKERQEAAARAAAEEAARQEAAASGGGGYSGGISVPSDGIQRGTIVSAAYSQIGVPYVWGGTSPGSGLDCSGLVQYCYACAGISIPRVSQDQRACGRRISCGEAKPGDILGNSHHVAIALGDGSYIEAPHTGANVRVASFGQFVDATRIIED